MNADRYDREYAMNILSAFPAKLEYLRVPVDTVTDDEKLKKGVLKTCLSEVVQQNSDSAAAQKCLEFPQFGRSDGCRCEKIVCKWTHRYCRG